MYAFFQNIENIEYINVECIPTNIKSKRHS